MPEARFVRSGQMVDCLRRELLYSEKRPRDYLFETIETVLSASPDPPLMVSQLARQATARARENAERDGFAFANWEHAGRAVVNAMLLAGVLLSPSGRSILPGIAAQAEPVAGLSENHVDLTEAALLEFLIRRLGDVTTRDHRALAHALFRQFDPRVSLQELEDRVVVLLARLADRVELRGHGYVTIEPQRA